MNDEAPARKPFEDEELLCPRCFYNLRGLTQPRCPECGEPFDRAALDIRRGRVQAPASPWDARCGWREFWRTWWMVASNPREFALGFPGWHNEERAIGYSACCYAFALAPICLVCVIAMIIEGDPIPPAPILSSIVAPIIGMNVCEIATAALLSAFIKPFYPRRRYHFWRGLTHYASGFAVVTSSIVATGVSLLLLLDANRNHQAAHELLSLLVWLAVPANGLWWAVTLARMVVARSLPGLGQVLAVLSPLAGAFAGLIVGFFSMMMCLIP